MWTGLISKHLHLMNRTVRKSPTYLTLPFTNGWYNRMNQQIKVMEDTYFTEDPLFVLDQMWISKDKWLILFFDSFDGRVLTGSIIQNSLRQDKPRGFLYLLVEYKTVPFSFKGEGLRSPPLLPSIKHMFSWTFGWF